MAQVDILCRIFRYCSYRREKDEQFRANQAAALRGSQPASIIAQPSAHLATAIPESQAASIIVQPKEVIAEDIVKPTL